MISCVIKYFLILFIVFFLVLVGIADFFEFETPHKDLLILAGLQALIFTIRRFTIFKGIE